MTDCADADSGCQEALAQLEVFLDNELPSDVVEDIRGHLADCPPCKDRASFEEQVRYVVARECAENVPDGLLERIRSGIGAAS